MKIQKTYPFQERVSKLLLAGKSVVLQAPTGSGKTMAAILPYLHAWREETNENFPTKCIYIVPMRVLANQFVIEYAAIADSLQRRFKRKLDVRIQTGEQAKDRRFEGDLIFCTIDQFLSSFLTMPYSLPNRWANLNAGAMVGSYLVFDEFHLLDPDSTLPSALYVIKQLSRVAPVLLMTATFSKEMLTTVAAEINGIVELIPDDEAKEIETRVHTVASRQRIWRVSGSPLNSNVILKRHQNRSLVLCNTVQRAKQIYRELRDAIQKEDKKIQLLLLHSQFLPEDRRRIEDDLRKLFGKDSDRNGSVIAIATQTIEVGVDITCEILHTELAPASSLIQRAGRCARYPAENGEVIVYPVESYMPYGQEKPSNPAEEKAWVTEMKAAMAWLTIHDGKVFDFAMEQAFVDAVASPRDRRILQNLSDGRAARHNDIHRVLEGDRQGQEERLLIRDADSRRILIHSDPDILLKNPYAASGFNLQLSTLIGMYNRWDKQENVELAWRLKYLREDIKLTKSNEKQDESNRIDYVWDRVSDKSLLTGARVVVVHPLLAGYLPDEGFVADQGDTGFESTLPEDANEQTWDGTSYKLESYEEHIRLVVAAFREIALPELQFPAQALERVAGWQPGSVLHTAWLVTLLHDVGKLSSGWQRWAHLYQQLIGSPVSQDFAVAHTDRAWGNEMHRMADKTAHGKAAKPHHAGEGAMAISPILTQALGKEHEPLIRAGLTAIVRHHTPFARECDPYTLQAQATRHIANTLKYIPGEVQEKVDLGKLRSEVKTPPNSFGNLLITPDKEWGWLAYLLLARVLRRADQEGTKRGTA